MSWWGKILGGLFGYLIDGYITAVLGALLGHAVDTLGVSKKKTIHRQKKNSAHLAKANYFSSTFSIMGHVSKADGHVSAEEIRVATMVMDRMTLTKPQREKAVTLFNEGKSASFPLDDVLAKLHSSCHSQKNLLRMFLEVQVMAALADGDISDVERHLLLQISERLGIMRMEYQRIEDRVRITMNFTNKKNGKSGSNKPNEPDVGNKDSLENAFTFLGVKKNASDREIKKAYRRLLSQHHPDKLVSKGLPEEMIKLAAQKTHEIRQAYETICASRGI